MTTFTWADAAHTSVRASDGRFIPADPANTDFASLDPQSIRPFARWPDPTAARADLLAEIEARARQLRERVAGTDDATKLAAYEQKYAIATQALLGDPGAITTLEPEAVARGLEALQLAALVVQTGDAWRSRVLSIEAASAAHKTAISALGSVTEAAAYDLEAGWPIF